MEGLLFTHCRDGFVFNMQTAGVEVRVAKIWLFGRLLQLPSRRGDEPGVITDRTAFCAAMLELLMARSVQ